jgi:hypothetical protein
MYELEMVRGMEPSPSPTIAAYLRRVGQGCAGCGLEGKRMR